MNFINTIVIIMEFLIRKINNFLTSTIKFYHIIFQRNIIKYSVRTILAYDFTQLLFNKLNVEMRYVNDRAAYNRRHQLILKLLLHQNSI